MCVKAFDREIEWVMRYPLLTRFRPSPSAFKHNERQYLHWCDKLFRVAYKRELPAGQAYDIGAIYMNELNIDWLRWRLPYTQWGYFLPVSDPSVPIDKVVVVNKPFQEQREMPDLLLPEHIPQEYMTRYCEAFGVEYERVR